MLSENQSRILKYLYGKDSVGFTELYDNCSPGYYHNGNKHFSMLLSNMVKQGLILRIRKGIYKFKSQYKQTIEKENKDQIKLL